ncbi:MAG: glycosyltransferase family 39 protein, partial [Planctomycetota bacterium]
MASNKLKQGQSRVMSGSRAPNLPKGPQPHQRCWVWIALLAVILFTGAIRLRLLAVPLERDEGEYAYAGQLILQGVPPYAQVYNMKMPGIYAAYALILAVFGQTHTGVHLGLLVINTATILLLFFLAKKLFDPLVGVVAAAAFALLSLGRPVQGIFANAEHFVILFALAGILLLLRALDQKRSSLLLVSAVLLGLAFIMKQHGAAFAVFAALYLFVRELRRRPFNSKTFVAKVFLFLIGVVLPSAVTCLLLWRAGVFEKFWFWTFDYARKYVSAVPLQLGLRGLKKRMTDILGSAILIWILAGVGVVGLLWNRQNRR